MADAAHWILTQKSGGPDGLTGNFFIDEDVLRKAGVSDLSAYAMTPGMPDSELIPDFFV
jgi:citronellol/citronellal dehydrogenase